jgi:hypothetical protein
MDKVAMLLAAKKIVDAFDAATNALTQSRWSIRIARRTARRLLRQPTYATNRMKSVDVEIGAALRGVRQARKNAQRRLETIARSKAVR